MLSAASRVTHLQFLKDIKLQQMTEDQQNELLLHLRQLKFLPVSILSPSTLSSLYFFLWIHHDLSLARTTYLSQENAGSIENQYILPLIPPRLSFSVQWTPHIFLNNPTSYCNLWVMMSLWSTFSPLLSPPLNLSIKWTPYTSQATYSSSQS